MALDFSARTLYRLPWNFTDNSISWLEPTSKCNLYCDGCYRENREDSHKSLEEVAHELDVFESVRRTDGVSIAGGDPLTHPEILEICRMVVAKGWKPIINTNGLLLTPELIAQLKEAGCAGFTVHIDSFQVRPHWKGKSEAELCELRLHYAKMIAAVGGMSCSFNATIYPETVKDVPMLAKWAQDHIDIVNVMVFIIYRMAILEKDYDFYVGDKKITYEEVNYTTKSTERRTDITSPEIVAELRKVYPDFMPSAYLNGTHDPGSFKWLLTGRMGNRHEIFGYVGPKFMEIVQTVKHLFTGSYLAYSEPGLLKMGRLYFLFSCVDKGIRSIAKNYFRALLNNPRAFFSRVHFQSVMIIQPADFMENGDLNMCDGCPDITVWNDKLVWSCRMEEQNLWGDNVRPVARKQ